MRNALRGSRLGEVGVQWQRVFELDTVNEQNGILSKGSEIKWKALKIISQDGGLPSKVRGLR